MNVRSNADDAEALALVQQGWEHLRLQRPLAAWASWQRALRRKPEAPAASQALRTFEAAEELPQAARMVYRLRSTSDPERRSRWNAAFQGRDMEDLDTAAQVFEDLTDSDPDDPDACWNQGLCLAWSGRNAEAIGALDRFVAQTALRDFEAAVSAVALTEILRQGAGAERLASAWSHSFVLDWEDDERDPVAWLSTFAELRGRPTPRDPATGQEFAGAVRVFEWLDRPLPLPATRLSGAELPRVRAVVFVRATEIQCSSPDRRGLQSAEREALAGLDPSALLDRRSTPLPIPMIDAAIGTFRLPEGLDDSTRQRLLREVVEDYFENRWPSELVDRGLLDPDNDPDVVKQARLEGVVRIREQLSNRPSASSLYAGYPFDRLRRRLGLQPLDPSTVDPGDVTCMSRSELERLDPTTLETTRLLDAFRSARALWNGFERRRTEADALGTALRRMAEALLDREEVESAGSRHELRETIEELDADRRDRP